ncbi:MAG: hypothetical protein FJY29_12545 [Betaproteobacteria bacterium]|nr:hypothetical protein [Betaproteobacteria bacterium]
MKNKIHMIYTVLGIVVACGPAQLSSETSNASTKKSGTKGSADGSATDGQILKAEKTIESSTSSGESDGSAGDSAPSVTLSFASPELSLHQGESKEIEVKVRSSKPNGSVSITPPSIQGLQFELLTAMGSTMAAALPLDASGNGTFKLKVTSPFRIAAGLVTAPGSLNANLDLRGSSDAGAFSAVLPIKVSNVAVYVMSGVTNVRELPARFEFPAGTIPVFANPSNRQVVSVMHFQGGSQANPFRHQAVMGDMPMGSGYCPLNTSTSALVPLGGAINAACLSCPAEATADITGTFYNHETENNTQSRTIVCKRKI